MTADALPELAAVPWRQRTDERWLRRFGRLWHAWTLLYTVPFLAAGVAMLALEPLTAPVALATLAHAWMIPELYAFRGASVVRPKGPRNERAEPVAQGLLGDLLGHRARDLQRETGLALEPGELGTWLVGEAGALLVTGRRVHCFCVRVPEPELPPSDRIAHLLLALRTDESGFATVANHAFAGAPWRVRRRLPAWMRPALDAARYMAFEVVIAGAGFGGLYAARRLEHRLPCDSARITMVADTNFLLYTPLLPGAAAGTLEPRHVVVPVREELDWTELRLATVTGADPGVNELHMRTADGREETLRYDQLIVSLGSVSRVLPVPGLAEHALGFKNLADAIALRNRAVWALEVAEGIDDPELRRQYLTFVFVGAGYAGVEGIAELQDFVADSLDSYPRCRLDGTRWILVEARERLMPEIPGGLADFAAAELRGRGLEIRTGTMLDSVEPDSATLSTGERIPTRTVCWTAGVKPPKVVQRLGLPLDEHGRIRVDRTMRVEGRDNVWAIGDAAAVPDPAKGGREPTPPTCQHALRQGKVAASNAAGTLRGKKPRPFRYRTLGVFVDMGRHKAVATLLGLHLRGFPAWFMARTYHLMMMPGHARRVRLMVDWTVGLFFGRASAELGQLGHPPRLGEELVEQTAGQVEAR